MMTMSPTSLRDTYGEASVTALAHAYETILRTISGGSPANFPDQDTRLVVLQAMLDEGHCGGFDPERLRRAAFSALQMRLAAQGHDATRSRMQSHATSRSALPAITLEA